MRELKSQLIKIIKQAGYEVAAADFTAPPDVKLGHLALPCFNLAKKLSRPPMDIAKDLAEKVDGKICAAAVAGPYVNFKFEAAVLAKSILSAAAEVEPLGKKTGPVMLEYSQPNTHKEFHIGHLRNACLGAFLVNLHREFKFKVVAANYIGDTGVHVAKCLWNFLKYHSADTLPANKGQYLGELYAEAVQRMETEPEAIDEVSVLQKKLEAGDKEIKKIWQETKAWSLESFYRVYDLLGIKFDKWFWESEEEVAGRKLLKKIIDRKLVKEIKMSEGALIADLRDYGLDVLVLVKSDGNVLYGAKDLPLGKKKFDKYKIQKSLYVVDKRQELYLKQIFKVLDLLGYADREKIHVPYEFVTLPEGAMASRKGNVITFESLYMETLTKVLAETRERHADWPAKKLKSTSEKIALAALKFWMLKYDNNSVVVFNLEQALALEGATGPYLMYALARINSLFRKAGVKPPRRADFRALSLPAEQALILQVGQYEETLKRCLEENSPVKLCVYLIELAKAFSSFYEQCPILPVEEPVRTARLFLADRTATVLRSGLRVLNIEYLDEM